MKNSKDLDKNIKQQIDYVEIENKLKTKHDEFIKSLGSFSDKTINDHFLIAETINARIFQIGTGLKRIKAIDNLERIEKNALVGTRLQKYKRFAIDILTDGDNIVLNFEGIPQNNNLVDTLRFNNALSSDFDWENFAIHLLDFIHANFYERSKAAEVKVKMILR